MSLTFSNPQLLKVLQLHLFLVIANLLCLICAKGYAEYAEWILCKLVLEVHKIDILQ